jgi:hypothetical protein
MTTSSKACRHFLVFFLGVEDDDKPLNLLSSFGFFPQTEKMTTSWETPGSLSTHGFFLKCELIGYITTWCIIIVPFHVRQDATP